MGRPHIEFIQSQALAWAPSPWQGLYGDTEVKVLSRDEGSGETSNLIRYPAGWSRTDPEYLAVDEELYVLGGELTITLLAAIGVGVEVHEMNVSLVNDAIGWLKSRGKA